MEARNLPFRLFHVDTSKMPLLLIPLLALSLILLNAIFLGSNCDAEHKIYPNLNSRVVFKGANHACHYKLNYKSGSFQTKKSFSSSQSAFIPRRVAGKRFYMRQAFFPVSAESFFKLSRSGETRMTNKDLTKSVLHKILKAKSASELIAVSTNLVIVITSTSKTNLLSSRRPIKVNQASGIYWRDTTQKTLFALASLNPSEFTLEESCSPLPKKGITRLKR